MTGWTGTVTNVTDDDWLGVLRDAADRVGDALHVYDDRRRGGERPDQYGFDLATDAVVLEVVASTGAGTFSEESGLRPGRTDEVVIIDPVDGSTNASYRIPHYACSLAVRDGDGIRVSLVRNLATGETFDAVRGGGARRDGEPFTTPHQGVALADAVVALTGHPGRSLGWSQFRALGACSLDVSYVACGLLDAFVDPLSQLGLWDYAAAHLVALEAGAACGEIRGRDLLHDDHAARRGAIYASSAALVDDLREALAAAEGPVGG